MAIVHFDHWDLPNFKQICDLNDYAWHDYAGASENYREGLKPHALGCEQSSNWPCLADAKHNRYIFLPISVYFARSPSYFPTHRGRAGDLISFSASPSLAH